MDGERLPYVVLEACPSLHLGAATQAAGGGGGCT